jgi:hypothetical protein
MTHVHLYTDQFSHPLHTSLKRHGLPHDRSGIIVGPLADRLDLFSHSGTEPGPGFSTPSASIPSAFPAWGDKNTVKTCRHRQVAWNLVTRTGGMNQTCAAMINEFELARLAVTSVRVPRVLEKPCRLSAEK